MTFPPYGTKLPIIGISFSLSCSFATNSFLSSSSVKQVAKFGGKINGLVPDEIVEDVVKKIKG